MPTRMARIVLDQPRSKRGRTVRPNSSTVRSGSAARLTVNMSWVTPAASAARTWATQSSGVPAMARRRGGSRRGRGAGERRIHVVPARGVGGAQLVHRGHELGGHAAAGRIRPEDVGGHEAQDIAELLERVLAPLGHVEAGDGPDVDRARRPARRRPRPPRSARATRRTCSGSEPIVDEGAVRRRADRAQRRRARRGRVDRHGRLIHERCVAAPRHEAGAPLSAVFRNASPSRSSVGAGGRAAHVGDAAMPGARSPGWSARRRPRPPRPRPRR